MDLFMAEANMEPVGDHDMLWMFGTRLGLILPDSVRVMGFEALSVEERTSLRCGRERMGGAMLEGHRVVRACD